jgi:antibiotic biosynthesis monooxygenase (ABM) superfamily enzyme
MTNLRPDAPSVSRLSTHQQAVLVWTAVLPTLTTLQLVLGRALAHLPEILRPVVVATLAVPIVVYVLVPQLQRVAARLTQGRRHRVGREEPSDQGKRPVLSTPT